jgi:RNA polymerase primary sigma factor
MGVSDPPKNPRLSERRCSRSAELDDYLDVYLSRIGKSPLLSSPEECGLAVRAKAGDEEAKNRLIESNLKLVVSVAKQYTRCGYPLSDLIQEGNLGLMKAVEAFDPERGFRFSTYAVAWIKQSITRSIEKQSRAIRIPSYVIQSARRLKRLGTAFANQNGREPTIDELCEQTKMPIERLRRVLESSEPVLSLDEYVGEEGKTLLVERLNDDTAADPECEALHQESVEITRQMVKWLTPQERLIIEQRFGIVGGSAATLQDIGKQLHITRERVRQLEKRALKKLRVAMGSTHLESYFLA